MGYFDGLEINKELEKYNGMKILKIESSKEGDEGIQITFENGDVLIASWSRMYGEATLNGIVI